jgi:hypothetical protein
MRLKTGAKREVVWDTNMAGVDMAQGHERCTRQLAQNVKRNARCLLSLGKTVRYIARIVFQSARTTAAKINKAYLSGAVVGHFSYLLTVSVSGHCHLVKKTYLFNHFIS